ncbi:MAG: EAL domain-containing protein [Alphaproteobacteria bacterium]|nr:EAL domain-containing protein [Alphaproteobacteria bacterium]
MMLPGAIFGSALGSLVLLAAMLFLSYQPGEARGLRFWAFAIALNVARMLSSFLAPALGKAPTLLLAESFHAGVVLLLLTGTWQFLGRKVRPLVLLFLASFYFIWIFGAVVAELSFLATTLPLYLLSSLVHFYMGWSFITYARTNKLWGGQVVGVLIALWGFHKLNYPWLRPIEAFAPFGFIAAEILALSISVGLLMIAQRRQGEIASAARQSAMISEQRLQLSERHLATVLHNLTDGIVTLDVVGRVIAANPAALAMFGAQLEQVLGNPFDLLVPGGDAMAQGLVFVGREREGDASAQKGFECLGLRPDGSHLPLEMMAAEIPVEGEPLRVVRLRDTSGTKTAVRLEDMMVNLTQSFAEGKGLNAMMAHLVESIASIFWVPLIWIGFCEQDGRISVKAYTGISSADDLPGTIRHDCASESNCLISQAVRNCHPISANRINDPEGACLEPFWKMGYAAMASIPLSAHSKVVAVLLAYTKSDSFPPQFLNSMERLSGRLGLLVQAGLDQDRLKLMAAAMEASSSAFVIADSSGCIEWGNEAYCRSTGYSLQEMTGRHLTLLDVKERGGNEYDALNKALESGETWRGEMVERRKDGSLYTVEQTVTPMLDHMGRVAHYVVVQEDLSEKRRAEERIRYLSHYDTLTALPNRHLFFERLNQAVGRALEAKLEVALLFVDLDQFSRVNDTLGHAAGDKLLIGVVERLRINARSADTLARIGGDEFGIVLVDAKASEIAAVLAEKINAVIASPFEVDGHEARLGANVGIAVLPADGLTADDLVRNADLALYRCIREHPGSYRFFSQDMNDEARSRLGIERDLRRAIEQKEFLLHYQPQLDTKTGRIVGMEALVRWQNPERGLVPPASFIPVAEDTGLIVPLGEWVLIEACKQARIWKDQGLGPITMAVNLSAVQFFRQDMVAVVRRILSDTGLDPSWLELELTESMVMHDAEAAILTLGRLSNLGLKMSIDDFGTGYSSLNYLRRFPVHRLKIDQSFVRELTNSANDAEIARAIISLGHSLELEVVSEGVETEAQLDYLKREGSDILQGYLFSRPVPAEHAGALLARQPFINARS